MSRRRPALVWIISLGYGLLTLLGFANTLLLLSGALPVPEPYRSDIAALGPWNWILSLAGSAAMLAYCIALFRLRASAVRWCEALLVLSVTTTVYQLVQTDIESRPLGAVGLLTTALGLTLLFAVYLYTRRLARQGALS